MYFPHVSVYGLLIAYLGGRWLTRVPQMPPYDRRTKFRVLESDRGLFASAVSIFPTLDPEKFNKEQKFELKQHFEYIVLRMLCLHRHPPCKFVECTTALFDLASFLLYQETSWYLHALMCLPVSVQDTRYRLRFLANYRRPQCTHGVVNCLLQRGSTALCAVARFVHSSAVRT